MISKEYFQAAVVAEPKEVEELNNYLARKALSKCFQKAIDGRRYGLTTAHAAKARNWRVSPYHYLRTDLALLLGPSGSKLLNRIWAQHHLSPTEEEPTRLRPALMKTFSVAARIAAPKGVGHALKRLVSDFEKNYFPVVVDPHVTQHRQTCRRYALLSVLQSGQGGHLLHGILEAPLAQTSPRDDSTYPSRLIEQDPTVARRRFLFEAACRAKSWSEAYRQARLLKKKAPDDQAVGKKLASIYKGMLSEHCPVSKKKQILTDLADCSDHPLPKRIRYALEATRSPSEGCRPGELENLICNLVPAGDPWWRACLSRLYRHQAVPDRWTADLRTLCQTEPTLRGFGRVLLNILRYSRQRAQGGTRRYNLNTPCLPLDRNQARARLDKVKESVGEWFKLLPPHQSESTTNGAPLDLPADIWSHISEVCSMLSMTAPVRARTCFQAQPARVEILRGQRILSLSAEFLSMDGSEQRFLLAKAFFRAASGLDILEARAASLTSPVHVFERAEEYAAWAGHLSDPLREVRELTLDRDSIQVALEEMYWTTGDANYQRLALLLHQGGWCPLFDREADLFAASFANIVSVSHALVKEALWGKQLAQACEREGLCVLTEGERERSVLCLRLQTVWLATAEEVQRTSVPVEDSYGPEQQLPDEVLG